jgi:prepilin-type N-terminal cleavage/methylation domain-containing protein
MRSKRSFTLLEILIGIALLAIASGLVGWKMHRAIQKKEFHSALERLKSRFIVCQRLAVATQADWQGQFQKSEAGWVFETTCDEGRVKKLSPLQLGSLEILLDGKRVNGLTVDFFASGQVSPAGTFRFMRKEEIVEWKVSELIQREEGNQQGPLYPSEKS